MTTTVHFSSRTDEWPTPNDLFLQLDAVFHFTLDPCASPENAKCARYFTIEQNGLAQPWDGERVFMNPPYGRDIGKWMKKAADSKALVVSLVPARTDTRWWHEQVVGGGGLVVFLQGRLKFGDGSGAAPFPSALVIFTGHALAGHATSHRGDRNA
jgi:phage N-6-adenine-methyltransferase